MNRLEVAITGMGLVFLSSPLLATPTAAELAAASEAQATGFEMFAYDQAAWHATDRFRQDITAAGLTTQQVAARGMRGYIVEPGEGGQLVASFYGERAGKQFTFARYTVSDGSTVVVGGLVEPDTNDNVSLLAQRMIVAREKALSAMSAPDHQLCSESPPNPLVLPPRSDGTLPVYILTSTITNGVYPAGGHFRFNFDKEGKMVGERRFMKTCFPLDFRNKKGENKEMIFLSHLLDPQPTEIHSFVSLNIPIPLMIVTTSNGEIWSVVHGKIKYEQDVDDK